MIEAHAIVLTWGQYAEADCLRVTGAPATTHFEVVPAATLDADAVTHGFQSLPGAFAVDSDALCFVPRWPFVDGVEYALIERAPSGAPHVVATLLRPASAAVPTTEVLAIYPGAAAVPVNLLKLYVQFSAPMSEGDASRAVHVRRADTGATLTDVFLPNSLELWDPERRRLTLLLDPGRIKRGLLPHLQMGYPLIEGVPILVSVDAAFRDAAGTPLRTAAERRYAVVPAVRTRIDPTAWHIGAPAAGTRDPLTVTFDRPLDRALLEHTLSVVDPSDVELAGVSAIGAGEQTWRFTPHHAWRAGSHRLTTQSHLEDLAGNSLRRVFDRDLQNAADIPGTEQPTVVEFAVR